ncbi:MAG TPA: PD-(D/E)XK nuclease family protein [Solirubrobacteraceae bacterium]|nr:PD-(D/E)XK nuclease family protein [Solirubrobacteraceae bacterium]
MPAGPRAGCDEGVGTGRHHVAVALTLVLGPANSAKAAEVLGAFSSASSRGPILVVPTSADALHYTRELVRDGTLLGSVLTFEGLAAEAARRAGVARRTASHLQRLWLVARVVRGLRLRALGRSAATAGFATAALALIAELERAMIDPARLSGALARWASADGRRAAYASDLAAIYSGYARELERLGMDDAELRARRALDALRAAPSRWGATPVFVYGFDDLTALELDAIETLAVRVGAPVTVSLTYEPGRAAMEGRAEVAEQLRSLATRVIELPARDDHYAPGSRRALHHLERRLFEERDDSERIEPGESIAMLEAGGELAEAELAAQEVLGLLERGLAPGEIALVHRAPESIAALFCRVFGACGIPLAAELRVRFSHTALGRAVVGAARCALAPELAAPGDLLALLRFGLIESQDDVDEIEAAILRGGARTAAEAQALAGLELRELQSIAGARDQAAELSRLARRLMARAGALRPAQARRPRRSHVRALAVLERAVAELAAIGSRPRDSELLSLLDALVVEAGAGALAGDAVALAGPLDVRARRFRAVLVLGLQEGTFPRGPLTDPFLPDELRFELAAVAGLRLRPRGDDLAAERHLFYATVSRATERVVLSYRSCDEEGNMVLPSPFIADVEHLLAEGWRDRRRRRELGDVTWPAALAPTERQRTLAAVRTEPPSQLAAFAGQPSLQPAALTGEPSSRLAACAEGAERARLRLTARSLPRVRHTRMLSAGALERYGRCPVAWLVESQLAPMPLSPEPAALSRGTVMHRVLEALVRELGGPPAEPTMARALELLPGLIDSAVAECGLSPGAIGVVRAAARHAIEAELARYIGHEARSAAAWRTHALEVRFGFDDERSLPPLRLGAGPDEVLLRGVIDRVDVDDRGRVIVRDYKSGAADWGWAGSSWLAECRLQVGLYMLALSQLTELSPVAGLYQPLRGADLRARGAFSDDADLGSAVAHTDARTPEELEELLAAVRDRALELAVCLRAGRLEPCPHRCSRDGCAHPEICRST